MSNLYFNSSDTVIVTKTPSVEFNDYVPNWFITKFVKYMSKGHIKVKDYQGNEIKVYYDYGDM
jgi:hypothetical protein